MRRFLCFVLCVFSLAVFAQKTSVQKVGSQKTNKILLEEQEQKQEKRTRNDQEKCGVTMPLRVAGFSIYPPFGWVEDISPSYDIKKHYISKGVFADIFQQVVAQTGIVRTRYSNIGYPSFQESYASLQKGAIDFFLGFYYDQTMFHPELRLVYPSLLQNPFVVVFVKGKERTVRSFNDLKGLTGIVRQEELVYPLIYKKVPASTKLVRVSGAQNAYLKLLSGEADFMITSQYANEAEMRRFKLIDKLFVPSVALFKAEMFIMANKNSPCYDSLKDKIGDILRAYKKDNVIEQKIIEGIDNWGILFKDEPGLEVPVKEKTSDKNTPPVIVQPA